MRIRVWYTRQHLSKNNGSVGAHQNKYIIMCVVLCFLLLPDLRTVIPKQITIQKEKKEYILVSNDIWNFTWALSIICHGYYLKNVYFPVRMQKWKKKRHMITVDCHHFHSSNKIPFSFDISILEYRVLDLRYW